MATERVALDGECFAGGEANDLCLCGGITIVCSQDGVGFHGDVSFPGDVDESSGAEVGNGCERIRGGADRACTIQQDIATGGDDDLTQSIGSSGQPNEAGIGTGIDGDAGTGSQGFIGEGG